MYTFRIECQREYASPRVVNIHAPDDLAAINRAFDIPGVIRAHSLGQTRAAPEIVVSFDEFERTQENPLRDVLAALISATAPIPQLSRRQAC